MNKQNARYVIDGAVAIDAPSGIAAARQLLHTIRGNMALTMPKYDPSDHDWRLNAACKDTDPSLFFPIGTTGLAIDQIEAAKQVCTTCPCMADCLQFALDTNQDAGVWGGLGEEERRVIRRQRAAARRAARLAAAEAQAGL